MWRYNCYFDEGHVIWRRKAVTLIKRLGMISLESRKCHFTLGQNRWDLSSLSCSSLSIPLALLVSRNLRKILHKKQNTWSCTLWNYIAVAACQKRKRPKRPASLDMYNNVFSVGVRGRYGYKRLSTATISTQIMQKGLKYWKLLR